MPPPRLNLAPSSECQVESEIRDLRARPPRRGRPLVAPSVTRWRKRIGSHPGALRPRKNLKSSKSLAAGSSACCLTSGASVLPAQRIGLALPRGWGLAAEDGGGKEPRGARGAGRRDGRGGSDWGAAPALRAHPEAARVQWKPAGVGIQAGPRRPGGKMAAGPNGLEEWVGSAYLFVESSLDKVVLSDAYAHQQQKLAMYRALRTALAESGGSPDLLQMLKIHRSDPQLIVQLRFSGRQTCGRFLRAYREGALRATLQGCLARALALNAVPLQLELRAGAEQLDAVLTDEERCLNCICAQKPDRLRDEELTELEDALRNLTCGSAAGQGGDVQGTPAASQSLAPSPPEEKPSPPPPGQTFFFQGQPIVNRPLNLQDQQKFARSVGLKWRKVGRSLQRSCRALRDPALDSLAYEYEREGLYEQAFQLLRRFVQAEGRRATLQRLVEALEENELTSLAEDLLGLTNPDGGLA